MSSPASWYLQIDPDIFKTIRRIPRRDVKVILGVIKLLPLGPYFGDIQKMKGEMDVWRRRVGAYRIFYKIINLKKIILVFRLERRTSKTY